MSGLTIIKQDEQPEPPGAWVTPVHLGRTADLSRVVDYYSPEAAWNFRSPGKKVTAEESARYGISPEHPFSPKPGETTEPTVAEPKAAEKPQDKAITRAEVEDKSVRRKRKGAR